MDNDDYTDDTARDRTPTWRRGFFMFAFILMFALAETVLTLIAILQFLWLLFTGHRNIALRDFGASLSIWMGDVARFQACDTEEKPFPWDRWPPSD